MIPCKVWNFAKTFKKHFAVPRNVFEMSELLGNAWEMFQEVVNVSKIYLVTVKILIFTYIEFEEWFKYLRTFWKHLGRF